MIKRWLASALVLLVIFNGTAKAAPAERIIAADIHFKISSSLGGSTIPNVRLIIIDRNGRIIANRLANSAGELGIKVKLPIDPRFPHKSMGTVTVIAVADGFNEYIDFDVPVNEQNNGAGRAAISLIPVRADARNEPSYNMHQFHRFTVFRMLDDYAEQVGLVKQKQIQGAEGFGLVDMPWSATIK
jgi:hypothetical protein